MQAVEKTKELGMSKDELIKLLGMAATQFMLRDILTKYGIPTDESVEFGFGVEDKAPISVILSPCSACLGLPPISKSFRSAIVDDFVAPMNTSLGLIKKIREFYGMPEPASEGRIKFEVFLKSKDFEMAFSGYCGPCPRYPQLWCYN